MLCTRKQSMFLHPRNRTNTSSALTETESPNGVQSTIDEPPPATSSSASNGCAKSSFSTASTSVTGLAIVPIRVRAKVQCEIVETYAFLDSGLNKSFCTEGLLERLDVQGTKTTLSLKTLESANGPIECSLVSLEAFHLNESIHGRSSFQRVCKESNQPATGPLGTLCYLPHHPVFNPQKPGKVRVVFNCSAKHFNTSLNDQLL